VPGSVDRYVFTASARQRIVVQARAVGSWCGRGPVVRWTLCSYRRVAPILEDQLLYSYGSCYIRDPVRLPVTGRYALVIHGTPPSWDHVAYAFVLVPLAR